MWFWATSGVLAAGCSGAGGLALSGALTGGGGVWGISVAVALFACHLVKEKLEREGP